MTTTLAHPELGDILGLDQGKVNQYRGIKYASLDHRFAEPVLFSNTGRSTVNATSFGPACVHSPAAFNVERLIIQHNLPGPDFQYSDTECLNLNIVTPKDLRHPVPVFVFIHGGGFAIGANSWPQYDPSKLIEISIGQGTPIIGISINYRLGLPGFLSSQELLSDGIKSNNGLRDQRAALTWVQNYVAGFGGDPQNVTVAGVSAGGASCFLNLESQQPLFKRIVSMGGTPLLLKPIPTQVAESVYTAVLEKLGLTASSPEERVKALKNTPMEKLLEAASNFPLLPIMDGDLVTVPATFSQWSFQEKLLPGTEWCESIMIGDCEMDSSVLFYMLNDRLDDVKKSFVTSIEHTLGDSHARQLLEQYGIDTNSTDGALDKVLHYANDIGFYAPLVSIASGWPRSSYVFHFNEPNPWSGQFQGAATHLLDAAFLFQNYNAYLDESQCSSAIAFAKHFIEFVVGSEPYPAYVAGKGGAMVYGSGEKRQMFVKTERSEHYQRRGTIYHLAESSSLEKLSSAWDAFMGGH